MKLFSSADAKTTRGAAYTLPEVVIAAGVLGMLSVSLLAAFSSGLTVVRSGRENMRATQIMLQKMETIRLLTWTQSRDASVAANTFTDYYDPTRTNTQSGGATYSGFFSNSAAPNSIPSAYRDNMRTATVTVFWTNYLAGASNNAVVHSRQYQTYVARYGLQNYVY